MLHDSETLMKAHNGIKNVDTIINGHTPAQTTWADLKEFAEFNKDLSARGCRPELKAGKTPEQAGRRGVEGSGKVQGLSQRGRESRTPSANPPLFGGLAGRIETLQKEMKK